jgi:hypothetical protein
MAPLAGALRLWMQGPSRTTCLNGGFLVKRMGSALIRCRALLANGLYPSRTFSCILIFASGSQTFHLVGGLPCV